MMIEDFDGNELEYQGEVDENEQACGQGVSSYTDKGCLVKYRGTFLNGTAEGRGKHILFKSRGFTQAVFEKILMIWNYRYSC